MNIPSTPNCEMLQTNITCIPVGQKYWLIRTLQGEFYDEFYHGNFIGIGWNEFCDKDEIEQALSSKQHYKELIQRIRNAEPEDKQSGQPGLSFTQLKRFLLEINIGDIIIIPNQNSRFVSFGIVTSDTYIAEIKEDDALEGACPFKKRRKVEWLKTVARDSLDPYLYRVLYSHHTITNADEYSLYIDRTLHSLYTKGDKTHLVLRVNTNNAVKLKDLSMLMDGIIEVIHKCNLPNFEAISEEFENLEVKINVQSPGPIEYIAGVGIIALIAAVIFVINRLLTQGGEFNFSAGWSGIKFNFKTEGTSPNPDQLLKAIEQSKDTQEKLKEIARAMQKLEVESPDEITPTKNKDQD